MDNIDKTGFISDKTKRIILIIIVLIILTGILIYRMFSLQIVHGEEYLRDFTLRIRKERILIGSRGNIYDRNGKLLGYNQLAYSVTVEDVYESGRDKNIRLNNTLLKVIDMIEESDDKIISDFGIILDDNDNFVFVNEDIKQLRFLADVYGHPSIDDLEYPEESATADEVIDYLCGYSRFGIGASSDPLNPKDSFVLRKGYTNKQIYQLVTIRYSMSANSFQKYIPTVIATNVNNITVAKIMENSADLDGVSIIEDTLRKYNDSIYMSHIIGYTGKISQEELLDLNEHSSRNDYILTDMVGKSGIEDSMELYLQGNKGSETVYVDNLGRVKETTDVINPIAGNDVHLTIDVELQKAVYNILEQKLAGILVAKIRNIKEFIFDDNTSASKILIPIYDVYFALINNDIIDIRQFANPNAKDFEKLVYTKYIDNKSIIFNNIANELKTIRTPFNKLDKENKAYQLFIQSMLMDNKIIKSDVIDKTDETYINWRKNETISLGEFLEYCIAMNWIEVNRLNLDSQYADSNEIFDKLNEYIFEKLDTSNGFDKKIYQYMILSDKVSGHDICTLLIEQEAISITDEELNEFINGRISSYDFMLSLIEKIYITPAQLALDPYSASCVVTNVKGEVLALVSYPGYDINRLANRIDSSYYSSLQSNLSNPLWNYATQQRTAPGSTYKIISAVAGIEEGVINENSIINCKGYFDRFETSIYKCHVYPSSHGSINLRTAIAKSCNSYFYEVGYQLGVTDGIYDSAIGVNALAKYADMFGLSEKSGIEIDESIPEVSDDLSVLSAIGQGKNNFTTVGLARYVTTIANSGYCYDLSLIDEVTDRNGNLIKDYMPILRNKVDLPINEWNAIHDGMRGVVSNMSYYNKLDLNISGKTGTAQESAKRGNHALFISYAPSERPEITVTCRIAFGYTSSFAAQAAKSVYEYYYDIEEEETILSGTAQVPDIVYTGD